MPPLPAIQEGAEVIDAGTMHIFVDVHHGNVFLALQIGTRSTRAFMPPAKARNVARALEDAAKEAEATAGKAMGG